MRRISQTSQLDTSGLSGLPEQGVYHPLRRAYVIADPLNQSKVAQINATHSVTEPVIEAVTESIKEAVTESIKEPVIELTKKFVTESSKEPVAETVTGSKTTTTKTTKRNTRKRT